MGYTNKTTHYELPQYVATDKPKYLTDFNETMAAIDTQMYTNAQAAATADSKADAAQGTADGAVSSIGTLNTQINGDPTDPSDTGLAGEVSEIDTDLNTVQSLIGTGAPTTSNQTIIGAINSLEAAVAPREDGDNLANSYSTGDQFARGGSVYEALVSLTAGTAFASLTLNTDYKVADTLVKQISDIDATVEEIKYYKTKEVKVSVTADGVKTNAQMLNELFTATLSSLQSMDDDEEAFYEELDISSGGTFRPLYRAATNAATTSTNNHFFEIFGTGTAVTLRTIFLRNNNSVYDGIETAMADGTITATSLGADVPAEGAVFALVYSVYKVIS